MGRNSPGWVKLYAITKTISVADWGRGGPSANRAGTTESDRSDASTAAEGEIYDLRRPRSRERAGAAAVRGWERGMRRKQRRWPACLAGKPGCERTNEGLELACGGWQECRASFCSRAVLENSESVLR